MSIIREDLEGSVTAYRNGNPITLNPGDEVPDGVTVGEHVLAEKVAAAKPAATKSTAKAKPAGKP